MWQRCRMFDIDRAAAYAYQRAQIPRVDLEEALRSGDLPAGTLPNGGWVIDAEDLEAWVDRRKVAE